VSVARTHGARSALAFAAALLTGCARGEADDMCVAERLPDTADPGVLTIGTMLPGDGADIHAVARWPDRVAEARAWPVAVMIHGAWDAAGTPVVAATLRPALDGGMVSVHLDLPGGGQSDGPDDRRGAASRAAVAAALQWAVGTLRDRGGCTLPDRVPGADPDGVYVVGGSNGGNLAVATLADPALDMPDVAGLVTWETPAGPQFTNVEFGVDPTVYTPGSCARTREAGIVCALPDARLASGAAEDGSPLLCFDLDADGACETEDVNVRGTRDPVSGVAYVSPTLAAGAAAAGVLPAGIAGAEEADAWWAERDAGRLADELVTLHPELPVLLLGSETETLVVKQQ